LRENRRGIHNNERLTVVCKIEEKFEGKAESGWAHSMGIGCHKIEWRRLVGSLDLVKGGKITPRRGINPLTLYGQTAESNHFQLGVHFPISSEFGHLTPEILIGQSENGFDPR
jgi:hypothetical protein